MKSLGYIIIYLRVRSRGESCLIYRKTLKGIPSVALLAMLVWVLFQQMARQVEVYENKAREHSIIT